ncbi:MAG TPA: methyltransferase domain-containing protein [Candidatus Obscuribacterales bacterium]
MADQHIRKVLNVGGNSKNIAIPSQYNGWQHMLLDIDPRGMPDIVCDARELMNMEANQYDAIYCSHNLEHYYRHDVYKVLRGFAHVLKVDGFVDIRVPDIEALMRTVVENKMDIDDFLYDSPAGPITVRDVIYGYGVEIERSGNDFFAHKTGFSPISLQNILNECGFPIVLVSVGNIEVAALAFKENPTDYVKNLFSLPTT